MTDMRCERCGVMTQERNRVEIHDSARIDLDTLCLPCRLNVEWAVREAIGLRSGVDDDDATAAPAQSATGAQTGEEAEHGQSPSTHQTG